MTQRVIFLDIDGPMIPGSLYLKNPKCSFDREFSPVCSLVIERLCVATGAKIVFNTTHNLWSEDLRKSWKDQVDSTLLHEDCHTKYPNGTRKDAIFEWLGRHRANLEFDEIKWVSLDDEKIGREKDGHILVDFDSGLTLTHYNKVMIRWNLKPFWIL